VFELNRSLYMKTFLIIFTSVLLSTMAYSQNDLMDSLELAMTAEYTNLKEALEHPERVVKLSLKKQGLKDFPLEILNCTNLQYLDLSKNKLNALPDSIIQLKKLQVLILSKNNLEALPNCIGSLHELRYFKVGQNKIARIPYSFGELENLEYLDFWDNELDYFPETLKNLKSLKVMDVRNILISQENQNTIQALLPTTKIYFSPACQCAW